MTLRTVHFGADVGEEGLRGLVGWVLREELAAEGTLEDGPAGWLHIELLLTGLDVCGALARDALATPLS